MARCTVWAKSFHGQGFWTEQRVGSGLSTSILLAVSPHAWCTDCTPFKLWCSEELFPLVFLSCVFCLFVCFYKNKKVIEEQFFSLKLSSFLVSTKTNYRPYQIPSSLSSSPLLNTHAHPQTHTFVQRILDRKRRNWFSPRITGTQNPSNNRRAMFTITLFMAVFFSAECFTKWISCFHSKAFAPSMQAVILMIVGKVTWLILEGRVLLLGFCVCVWFGLGWAISFVCLEFFRG